MYWPNELPVSVIEIREILRLWLEGRGLLITLGCSLRDSLPFDIVDDREFVVYANGRVAARFDGDGRVQL
jgi:hypothetical protein